MNTSVLRRFSFEKYGVLFFARTALKQIAKENVSSSPVTRCSLNDLERLTVGGVLGGILRRVAGGVLGGARGTEGDGSTPLCTTLYLRVGTAGVAIAAKLSLSPTNSP